VRNRRELTSNSQYVPPQRTKYSLPCQIVEKGSYRTQSACILQSKNQRDGAKLSLFLLSCINIRAAFVHFPDRKGKRWTYRACRSMQAAFKLVAQFQTTAHLRPRRIRRLGTCLARVACGNKSNPFDRKPVVTFCTLNQFANSTLEFVSTRWR
jgi:hypothetical protein